MNEDDSYEQTDEFFTILAMAVAGVGLLLLVGIGFVLWLI